MILPGELERIRDLRTREAEAHIDLCRPRVLVLERAPESVVGDSQLTLLRHVFTDKQGASGLYRGDCIRGELYGRVSVDSGGLSKDLTIAVLAGTDTVLRITASIADSSGDPRAFVLKFSLRLSGGENVTINTPAKSSDCAIYGQMSMLVGDTYIDAETLSQDVYAQHVTVSHPTDFVRVNLAAPVSVSVLATADTDLSLVTYGGTLEGL